MNLINLVKLIISREQRAQREYFIHNAAYAPNVHFVTVIAVSE